MKQTKVRWGILGAAKIAVKHVIPAMKGALYSELMGIASRSLEKAQEVANQLHIPKAYGSYEALLEDPDIDAIYIPLPNHLHVEWSKRCMEAGKHVLCEKPLALNCAEMEQLMKIRDETGLKIAEAFMVRTHPQWLETKAMIDNGDIGQLKTIHGFFSFMLDDISNVRYVKSYGGGGVYDIGCYPIMLSRFIYGEEPTRVFAHIQYDEKSGVDVLASAILDFPSGTATFTCSIQLQRSQTMQFYGTEKSLEVKIPFNSPPGNPNKLYLMDGDISNKYAKAIILPACNQYRVHVDHFSQAVLMDRAVAVPLEDTYHNTKVIEAILRSGKSEKWEAV